MKKHPPIFKLVRETEGTNAKCNERCPQAVEDKLVLGLPRRPRNPSSTKLPVEYGEYLVYLMNEVSCAHCNSCTRFSWTKSLSVTLRINYFVVKLSKVIK